MERLTGRNERDIACFRMGDTEYIGGEIAERLADYEDAEEQGRLVVLPCKVGDTVYMFGWLKATEYFSCHIDEDSMLVPSDVDLSDDEYGILETPFEIWMYEELGKTVFLSPEEAEAALRSESHEKTT